MVYVLLKWLGFSIVLGILPLFLKFLYLKFANSKKASETKIDITNLIGRGELLLVANALAVKGLADIVNADPNYQYWKLALITLGILQIICATFMFGIVTATSSSIEEAEAQAKFLSKVSLWIYIGCVMTGAGCVIVSEMKP